MMVMLAHLPRDVLDEILAEVVKHHSSDDGSTRGLAAYASVCEYWRDFFESMTFRNLLLAHTDLGDFEIYLDPSTNRRRFVKHIALTVQLPGPAEALSSLELDPNSTALYDAKRISQKRMTYALRDLLLALSKWDIKEDGGGQGLTLELGAYSPVESTVRFLGGLAPVNGRETNRLYSKFLESGTYDARRDPDVELLEEFRAPPPGEESNWNWAMRRLVGDPSLRLDFGGLLPLEHHSREFATAAVVTKLLVRLRYFRNLSPMMMGRLLTVLPRVRDVHWERWCHASPRQDRAWSHEAALILQQSLPASVKNLTIFAESDTAFHQRRGITASGAKVSDLVDSVFDRSTDLEDLSISFLIDAVDFFGLFPSQLLPADSDDRWSSLTSLALTSTVLTSESDAVVNKLLQSAARAAWFMPSLRVMEVWDRRGRHAAIFRYQVTDRVTTLAWKGTWELGITPTTKKAWVTVVAKHGSGMSRLGVEIGRFPEEDLERCGFVYGHLELRERILHEVSIHQVEEVEKMEGRDIDDGNDTDSDTGSDIEDWTDDSDTGDETYASINIDPGHTVHINIASA
ncbi:uncharacterized protein DNG_02563 [Cephalotrichum gorgonifer]|uniref:DUF6546 domain-containing protein n=1 Tax=Cephalotrichum gorgonifer TaxID=2041049 RepID=A0AAE8SSR4_9PEZI|nr:uncharacterized protein DNG_02563 [Cephalotrichum gorgonifer]